jgi:oxygen-independent coproporphyrinogen-3 oxidase
LGSSSVIPTGNAGIYVHFPFCARRCPYCDFAIAVTRNIPHEAYADAVIAELAARSGELDGRNVRSLYFGGGTPGLWRPAELGRVVRAVAERWRGAENWEITLEANPEHFTAELARAFADQGIGRVSLGVQSFDADALAFLGRAHSGELAAAAAEAAMSAGIDNVSVDLIYGLPEAAYARSAETASGSRSSSSRSAETASGSRSSSSRSAETASGSRDRLRAEADARRAVALGVAHVSAYELTIEDRTSFGARLRRGELRAAADDVQQSAGDGLRAVLAAAGFERYEISNLARPGKRSRHNQAYWAGDEYLGLGVGAHSFFIAGSGGKAVPTRRGNTRSTPDYLGRRGVAGQEPEFVETLDAQTHAAECAMLALRTLDGLDFAALEGRFGRNISSSIEKLADSWQARGLGQVQNRVFRPSELGFSLADSLAAEVFGA